MWAVMASAGYFGGTRFVKRRVASSFETFLGSCDCPRPANNTTASSASMDCLGIMCSIIYAEKCIFLQGHMLINGKKYCVSPLAESNFYPTLQFLIFCLEYYSSAYNRGNVVAMWG